MVSEYISGKIAVIEATSTTRWEADLELLLKEFPSIAEKHGVTVEPVKGNWHDFLQECWLADDREIFQDVSKPKDVCEPECWTEQKNA